MNFIAVLKNERQPKPRRSRQAFPSLYLRDVGGITGHVRTIKLNFSQHQDMI